MHGNSTATPDTMAAHAQALNCLHRPTGPRLAPEHVQARLAPRALIPRLGRRTQQPSSQQPGNQARCSTSSTLQSEAPTTSSAGATHVSERPFDPEQLYALKTTHAVVNFYHLVDIDDPQAAVTQHRQWLEEQGLDISGRIYFSRQGVNAQFGGALGEATAYTRWVAQQPLFAGLRYTVWPASGHMFPKLRLKVKPNLISLAGGMAGLPVTDASARATPLPPAQWKSMLAAARGSSSQGAADSDDTKKRVVVLDVRNSYEWDAGHFVGADRPAEETFSETPAARDADDEAAAIPAPLRQVDKDTPVMMYCTGGIRCDVYSTFLRSKGFNNLYTLEGGIQGYLRQEGPTHWDGSLFVFDGRMALPAGNANEDGPLPAAVPCELCGAASAQLPHMNCANIDCNDLFIACAACKARHSGCCCAECEAAPRLLRPAKLEGGQYGTWGNYADEEDLGPLISMARKPGARAARRARHREATKARREAERAKEAERRQMVKAALARLEVATSVEQQATTSTGGAMSAAAAAEMAAAPAMADLRQRLLARRLAATATATAGAQPRSPGSTEAASTGSASGGGSSSSDDAAQVCFACIQNAGRSQMAAGWFNALVDPSSARAVSAGSRPAKAVHPEAAEVMREVGITVGGTPPQLLTREMQAAADVVVTMGCGEDCLYVGPDKLKVWPLPDPHNKTLDDVRIIRDNIKALVLELAREKGWRLRRAASS